MSQQPPTPLRPAPDDPFERELHAVLRDRAAGPVPASLTGAARRAATSAPSRNPLRRAFAGITLAAAAVLLLALAFNPISMIVEGIRPPAGSSPLPGTAAFGGGPSLSPGVSAPTSPSASPVAATPSSVPDASTVAATGAGYRWTSPMVTLTADDIILTADGARIPAPEVLQGGNDPGDQRYRTLEIGWPAHDRGQRMNIYLAADDTHWWVSEWRIYDDQTPQPDWISFAGPMLRTPIGQAYHGDIRLTEGQGRVPGSITIRNATLDPVGLGGGPRSFADCTLPADLDGDVIRSLNATLDLARVAAIVAEHAVCVRYTWYHPTPDGGDVTETWCVAPPSGTIHLMKIGPHDELVVLVNDDAAYPVRPQPLEGWGCPGGAAVPSASPDPAAAVIDWGGPGVTFRADDLSVDVGGNGFSQMGVRVPARLSPTTTTLAPGAEELRWTWGIEGDDLGLTLKVETDGDTWKVSSITLDATTQGGGIRTWDGKPIGGRTGEAWTGDLVLGPATSSGGNAATVTIPGLTFDPFAGPAASPLPSLAARYDWSTSLVSLTADEISLRAGRKGIPAPLVQGGHSDPGGPTYRTLELSWRADGREQRLFFYLAADETDWWVFEARIYDDLDPQPDWITFQGPFMKTPLGEAFHGNLAIASQDGRVPGAIVLRNATLDPIGFGLAASPTPSPALADIGTPIPAYQWSGDGVLLTASGMTVGLDHVSSGTEVTLPRAVVPTRRQVRPGVVELVWSWTEDGRPTGLSLLVEATADEWAVTQAQLVMESLTSTPLTWSGTLAHASLGSPWHGDISASSPSDGVTATLHLTGVDLDPGPIDDIAAGPSPSVAP